MADRICCKTRDTDTVKEIKELLNQVKVEQYYITDNDDSQLLSMVSAINNMRYHKEIIDNNEVDITN